MGRLMVITTPDLASGFQLAGVETFVAENAQEAETILHRLLDEGAASLIAVRQDLLQGMDLLLQRRIETRYPPVVMTIPAGVPVPAAQERRSYIAQLIQRAIGFHITFGDR